jgi:hypothetical protein
MYPHSALWHYLWIAPHVLQVAILVIMVRRSLHRQFPMFFAYTIWEVAQGTTLFTLDHLPVSAYAYWAVDMGGLVVSSSLRFAVIYEVFSHVFRSYSTLAGLSRNVLRWTAALLLFAAAMVSAYTPKNDFRIFAGINTLDRGVLLMQSGMLLVLFIFSFYFRLPWKNFAFGIAVGLGIYASVDLARVTIRIATGPKFGNYSLDFISMATYHCSVLVWLAYLFLPENAGRPSDSIPDHDLEEWNNELRRFLSP